MDCLPKTKSTSPDRDDSVVHATAPISIDSSVYVLLDAFENIRVKYILSPNTLFYFIFE